MNILLINHYAGSKDLGMEYRPYFLAREWVGRGHAVTVVAASFSHVRRGRVACDKPICEQSVDGIRYVWLRTPAYRGNGFGRVRNMLTFIGRVYRHRTGLVGDAPPDAVIASSTYPWDIYPARAIARAHGAALVFEVHDLWPLSPMEIGGMPWWHPFIMTLQRAEDYACRHADRIVSILPKAGDHLRTRGMDASKYHHVPNGVCPREWETPDRPLPEVHAASLQRARAGGRFLVGYTGAHGPANALDVLIDAATRLREAPVTFVLAGQGPEKERLRREARGRGLSNVELLPAVGRESVPALLRSMDALYIGLKRQPLFRFGVSPNKLFDYMMAGKPVIQAIEACSDLVADSGCGISIRPEDPDAVALAVRTMMGTPATELAAMGQRGRQYVLGRHDYRVLAGRFLEVLDGTVSDRPHPRPRRRAA